jgi:metal-dependent amidase/aminoacylase/carboxypeptidase family protein
MEVPAQPKTTFKIGVLTGGTSVNTIPASVSMDVDLRSESAAELSKLVDRFHSPPA